MYVNTVMCVYVKLYAYIYLKEAKTNSKKKTNLHKKQQTYKKYIYI